MRRTNGTASYAAYLSDPDVIAEMAAQPEPDDDGKRPTVPLEGFSALDGRIANLEDRITQLVALTARTGVGASELAARPEYPHIVERERVRRERLDDMIFRLTGGE